MSFSTTGTHTVATLEAIKHASANNARPRYSHKNGNMDCRLCQSRRSRLGRSVLLAIVITQQKIGTIIAYLAITAIKTIKSHGYRIFTPTSYTG